MATEMSQLGQEPAKRVQFSFPQQAPERDLGESARLLAHQAFSPFSQHTNSCNSEFHTEEVSTAPGPMVPPQPNIMFHKPADLQEAPDDVDSWPKHKMRIACTHCGHYIETLTSNETEYMGCKPCFWGKPVFRQSVVHYCPNCNEAIGFHYTGEDCFCNHNKSTMTFDRVLAATCCAWGSD